MCASRALLTCFPRRTDPHRAIYVAPMRVSSGQGALKGSPVLVFSRVIIECRWTGRRGGGVLFDGRRPLGVTEAALSIEYYCYRMFRRAISGECVAWFYRGQSSPSRAAPPLPSSRVPLISPRLPSSGPLLPCPADFGARRERCGLGLPAHPDGDLPVDEQEINSRQPHGGPEPHRGMYVCHVCQRAFVCGRKAECFVCCGGLYPVLVVFRLVIPAPHGLHRSRVLLAGLILASDVLIDCVEASSW